MKTTEIKNPAQLCNLIELLKNADSETIRFIYKSYLPDAIAFIKNKGGNEQDARDVFQEAVLALYKQAKSGKLNLTANLKTYLLAICKNQWLKSLRKTSHTAAMIPDFDPSDFDQDLMMQLEKAEQFRLIYAHIKKMSPTNQAILTMHLQKFSTEQIAKALNFSAAYVKKRKFLSKKELVASVRNDKRFQELII